MRLVGFLLLHAQTVQIGRAGEDRPGHPITAATLARIPAAHLSREVSVSGILGTPAGQLWVGDGCYSGAWWARTPR